MKHPLHGNEHSTVGPILQLAYRGAGGAAVPRLDAKHYQQALPYVESVPEARWLPALGCLCVLLTLLGSFRLPPGVIVTRL